MAYWDKYLEWELAMFGERFKQIRQDLGWTLGEMAKGIGVTQETVSNWESNKYKMPLERLKKMSEVTGFPLSYLLGEEPVQIDMAKPLSRHALKCWHRKPVWTRTHGWGLVNLATKSITLADGKSIAFDDLTEGIYGIPPALSISVSGFGTPLTHDEIPQLERVWLEPIGTDVELNAQLRGWYHPYKTIFVTNELGVRFYLDTYGAKWLAFAETPSQGQ